MTTKPVDPLAQIEHAQATLAKADAPLAQLEAAKLELTRVVASCDADLEELGSRRKIEMSSAMPAGELDKKLDAIEKREREVVRRNEIASIVLGQFEPRIVAGREDEAAARRQARYDQALALHAEATDLIRNFLGNVAPAARAALAAYSESEAATAAANRDLPPGASKIPTIESERMGDLPPAKTTEKRFQAFVRGRDFVAVVGSVDAAPASSNTWTVFIPSASMQGGTSVGGCEIVDFVDVRIEKFEPRRVESLATALRVPPFYATAPERGSIEKMRVRLSEWRAVNGEPEQAPRQIAAEPPRCQTPVS
jgi:hypothetical protein